MADAKITAYHGAQIDDDRLFSGAHPVGFLKGIVGYSTLKGGVRLIFWSGQSFAYPGLMADGPFQAAEKRDVSPADIHRNQQRLWLAEARTVQWDCKNIAKRKVWLEWLGEGQPPG